MNNGENDMFIGMMFMSVVALMCAIDFRSQGSDTASVCFSMLSLYFSMGA